MPDMTNMIPLKQFALEHGITPDTARQRAIRGAYKTAVKIGYSWFISADEEQVDHRLKDGSYVGDRAKRRQRKALKEEQTTDDNI